MWGAFWCDGDPDWIRTSGLKIRNLALYPTELRDQHYQSPACAEHFPTHTVFHGFRQPRKKRGRRIYLHIAFQAARAVSITDTK